MDPSLLDHVITCGYEPFQANIVSDHRGIFIDFKESTLFRGGVQPLLPMALRDISSKKPHQIPIYFSEKGKYLSEASWFEKVRKLRETMTSGEKDDHTAEILYQQMLDGCQHAGKKLKPYFSTPYSPEIVRLRNIEGLMRMVIKSYKSKFDLSIQVDEARGKLGSLGFELPDNLKDCQKLRREYSKQLKAALKDEETTSRHAEEEKSISKS
jgi:hypothetical protein